MALTTDQLRNLSRLYDRWQSGDTAGRDAVQREVDAVGADVVRAFAQMFSHADTEAGATLLPSISQAMREAAVLAAGQPSAGSATNANLTRFGATLSDTGEMPAREPGQHIGPYRLIKELGRGGMGVVWLAERADGQHSRQVALKMPLVENLNWLLAARFARERNILASLEHPSIARLYDAGVDQADHNAQPYIAIEYVQGQPITDYVKEKRLKPEATALLFIRVIEAVAHAHTQLVIHRDIKPSNILVDARGAPHLLDFGIAKLLDDEDGKGADATQLTRLSGRALTLDYASPEQVNNASLGTASDVYSLGIVFYELLTGSRPYRPKGSTRRDLEQAILDQDPAKPSDQLLTANTGDNESGKSARRMRGDLDTVVLKALRKDPKQRYATAQAFADDLKRYLAYEPIAAKPDAGWYRVGRFVRRNRWALAASGVIAATVAMGVVSTLWQAQRAEREAGRATQEAARATNEASQKDALAKIAQLAAADARQQAATALREAGRADQEALRAESERDLARGAAVNANQANSRAQTSAIAAARDRDRALAELELADAMSGLISVALGPASNVAFTTADVLNRGEAMINKQYSSNPRTRAFLLLQLASLWGNAGGWNKVEPLVRSSRAAAVESNAPLQVADADCYQGAVHVIRGEFVKARLILDLAIETIKGLAPETPGRAAQCLLTRARLNREESKTGAMLADVDEGLRLIGKPRAGQLHKVLALRELKADGDATLGRLGSAVAEYEAVLSEHKLRGALETNTTQSTINSFGILLMRSGQSRRAEEVLRLGVKQALGETNGSVFDMPRVSNYARALLDVGRRSDALPLIDRALAEAKQRGSPRDVGNIAVNAAEAWCEAGDTARCEALLTTASETLSGVVPAKHPVMGRIALIRGQLELNKNSPQAALESLERALAILTATGRPEPRRMQTLVLLAQAELRLSKMDAALARANEAVAVARDQHKDFPSSERVGSALLILGTVQAAAGKKIEARIALNEALRQLESAAGADTPKALEARRLLTEI